MDLVAEAAADKHDTTTFTEYSLIPVISDEGAWLDMFTMVQDGESARWCLEMEEKERFAGFGSWYLP